MVLYIYIPDRCWHRNEKMGPAGRSVEAESRTLMNELAANQQRLQQARENLVTVQGLGDLTRGQEQIMIGQQHLSCQFFHGLNELPDRVATAVVETVKPHLNNHGQQDSGGRQEKQHDTSSERFMLLTSVQHSVTVIALTIITLITLVVLYMLSLVE